MSSTMQERLLALESLGASKLNLPYKSIPGVISAKALEEHLKLYYGYQELLKRVDHQLNVMEKSDLPKKHMADHSFRCLKEAETYALGGILLHELYFNNLTDKSIDNKELEIKKYIKQECGSLNQWKAWMRATILEAKGWAVFATDKNKQCRILMIDGHNIGTMFGWEPLVVIDKFEHAYWDQFWTDVGGYADAILNCLNWEEINKRYLTV